MNNYDTSDFNRGQWQAQQQKLHATPARSPRLPRPKKSPYATPINRRPPKYEPAPHWFRVISTACLFFAGVFVVMFVLVVILHVQIFAR